jgi:hypothetical protein
LASNDQSIHEYQVINGRIPNRQLTQKISPEVYVLARTLVPVMSTVHLVVRELIGVTSLALHKGTVRTYTMRILNDMSNPLEYLLALHCGKGQEPLTRSLGNGHEQSPMTRSKGHRCSKPSRRWQPPRVTKNPTAYTITSVTRCSNSKQMH